MSVGSSGGGNNTSVNTSNNQVGNFQTGNQTSNATTEAALENQETLATNGSDMKLATTVAQEEKNARDQIVVG